MKEHLSTYKERLSVLSKHYGCKSLDAFGAKCGKGGGVFSKSENPTASTLNAIHTYFPDANIMWLIFGEGEMIIEEKDDSPPASHVSESIYIDNDHALDRDKEIKLLEQTIRDKDSIIESKNLIIDLLQQQLKLMQK